MTVEQGGDVANGGGAFMLHQGIQRRIAVTIVHEHGPELVWKDAKEVVIGGSCCRNICQLLDKLTKKVFYATTVVLLLFSHQIFTLIHSCSDSSKLPVHDVAACFYF